MDRSAKERMLALLREKRIRECRSDFWTFCQTLAPDFYLDDRWHLRLLCGVLQALYERRLTKQWFIEFVNEVSPHWYVEQLDLDTLEDGKVYEKLMLNEPPRTGKSRTLILGTQWFFGKDKSERVLECSYNDMLAQDFSRYTRDGIMQEKNFPHEIVYADIFPETKIKRGDAAFGKWALEGQYFSYKGSGVGGGITGKGGTIVIVDDIVKDAEEALNDARLDVIWQWYTGTFMSRTEERDGKEAIEIINMTRWSKKDICGRILTGEGFGDGWSESIAKEWFVLRMEAAYGEHMLCPSILSRKKYERLKKSMLPEIFEANYHQKPIDVKGRLYSEFKTYTELPPQFERIINYTDTADEGKDYLASIVGGLYKGELYILDSLYTNAPMEVTEPLTAKMLVDNNVNLALFESNNGGRGFARNVERLIWQNFQTKKVVVKWFHQTQNKKARILTQSSYIVQHVYFPHNWRDRWPELYRDITSYQRDGKNKHDDAPDALTGLCEMVNGNGKRAGAW